MKHEESKIQRACVHWFRSSHPRILLVSFLNGVYIAGTPGQRAMRWNILKAEGAVVGIPDLMVCHASKGYHALYVEMKTEKGKLSYEQKLIHAYLINAGYCVKICRSFDEFTITINNYLQV